MKFPPHHKVPFLYMRSSFELLLAKIDKAPLHPLTSCVGPGVTEKLFNEFCADVLILDHLDKNRLIW